MELLGISDRTPFEVFNRDGSSPVLLICDHASHAVPAKLSNLGLNNETIIQHIGWDIGAARITRELSTSLDSVAVLAGYSRLVVDTNRHPNDPDSIPNISDGISIPGNQHLSQKEKLLRTKEIFWPYHNQITRILTEIWERGLPPVLFSIHTFTPSLQGENRPWHAGVLWNRDPRIAKPLIANLRKHFGASLIGDNLPYSGKHLAYSLDSHASKKGLSNCAIEIRQDQINSDSEVASWTNILAMTLKDIFKKSDIHCIKHY